MSRGWLTTRITMRARCVAASVALAFLAAGCLALDPRGTAQNTYTVDESGEVTETFGDRGLAKDLVMEDIRTERRDGRLHVQFNLRNTRSSNLAIEWAIAWFDGSGFRIDVPEHWTPAAIGGKGYETVTRTAPTPEASSFRLGFRKPNTVR